ncbi:MAG: AtpZ/AtpI family protein [Ignavibacteria bacterium]|jgi:ATP synthase protein I|nr:AtpZ/AtpI family protein [Ignavibacteria bacterium]
MNQDKQEQRTIYNSVSPYINLGMQMALTIVVFVLLGWWLDGKFETSPVLTLVLSGVGMFGAFYKFIRSVISIDDKNIDDKDKKDAV